MEKKKLFWVDENGEGYKNYIKELEVKNTIDNSIDYHSTQIFPRLPYTMDVVRLIKFNIDMIVEAVDEFNELYLLLFEKDKFYACLDGFDKGIYAILLVDNKKVYFIKHFYPGHNTDEVEIVNGYRYYSSLPSYIRVDMLIYLKSINKDYLINLQLFYDFEVPYTLDINKIVQKQMNHDLIFINRKSYEIFLEYYKTNEDSYLKEIYYSNTEEIILQFNQDYHIKINDDIIYFEKDNNYIFEFSINPDITFTIQGLDCYNLTDYYDFILSITNKLDNRISDISLPNIIKNISTLDINKLKDKVIQYYGNIGDNIIILYDQISDIYIIDIYDKNINNMHKSLYKENYDIKLLSIINGNVLNNLTEI